MATLYETPGKQAFRELVRSVAISDGLRTFGTFWGTGIDSALMSAAGFDVIACEIVRAKHDALVAHAQEHGYRAWPERAGRLTERREMFHADFDGGPSPRNFRELRRVSAVTDRWMAVTISLDHLRDASMMGEAAFYTIPAWLTGATGMTLEYLGRYTRNRLGQVMWTALLRRKAGKGTRQQVLPMQIAYSIGERAYWASRNFYTLSLLTHRYSPRNEHEKEGDHARYVAKRQRLSGRECRSCGTAFQPTHGRQIHCATRCRQTTYRKAWYTDNRDKQIEAVRAWRIRKRAAVSGTTAEAINAA